MAREINEILQEILDEKNKRLELDSLNSDSNVSIFRTWAYVQAVAIHTFEIINDLFKENIDKNLSMRINGTPQYYIQALLKFQYGDSLRVLDGGTRFGYETTDETKRIISKASYQETKLADTMDSVLLFKVAKGKDGELEPLTEDELVSANAYLNSIKFAGTLTQMVSRKGDVLVPNITVYHDGGLPDDKLRSSIREGINKFISSMQFDSALYVSNLLESISNIEHVKDVYIDPQAVPAQGIYIYEYDAGGIISQEKKIDRVTYLISGYMKESTKKDSELNIPNWDDAIVLKLEQ